MKSKKDLIVSTIRQLLRITNKHSRIEKLPIHVEGVGEISTREIHTIQAIGDKKQMSVTDVAVHFGVTKSASSQLIDKLTRKGFLTKAHSPHSNKELQSSLTELGWRAFHIHEQFHGEDMKRLVCRLEGYSLQQITSLSVLLDAIGEIMDERLDEM